MPDALWLSSAYNIMSSPERICVSSGASGNLVSILQKFTEPRASARCRVPEDVEGLDIEFLRTSIQEVESSGGHSDAPPVKTNRTRYPRVYKHIIYAVPTFANPRPEDTQANADADHLPNIPPRIVDVDLNLDGGLQNDFGNVASNSSFSKTIGPGVRTGWNEATPAFTHALSSLGSQSRAAVLRTCPRH
ncbi:uncharacterized protein J7T54_006279 [Emericellopsis cladophorae]|uniref:Uncharacterized protein n=1 Tax=Emericellopsis cladophorae TaxID=2686198 RepID=A0A9P9YA63_9HYPO|nr:uncharacterized protein J7T54_006279 [Emericellopsis cladophorae]KAI6785940.1 hypothetical protein J7T54_006279 [Emericellopsis cladophorae]